MIEKDVESIVSYLENAQKTFALLQHCCEGLVESQKIMNERFAILKKRVDELAAALAMRSRNP